MKYLKMSIRQECGRTLSQGEVIKVSKDDLRLGTVGKIEKSRERGIKLKFTILFLIFIIIAGCSTGEMDSLAEENQVSKKNISTAKGKLLFFLNPNGPPCQVQERILSENEAEIQTYADVEYVSTTVKEDRGEFYKYGIRALPALVLLDKEGNVVKRFSPGIRKIGEIMQSIKKGV